MKNLDASVNGKAQVEGRSGGIDRTRDRSAVQSVERCLDILEALAENGPYVAIVELSRQTGLHVSTVHRLLATLVSRGYVRQDPETNKYALGLRAVQLAAGASIFGDLRATSKPHLQELMELSGETANLVVIDGDEAVYVEQVEGPRLVRMFTKIGKRVPLHSTGVGKVLMSHMSEQEVEAIAARRGLPAFTRKTITNLDKLKTELRSVRAQGFALDNEEQEEGVRCVAAPVYDHDSQAVAAISVSAPVTRLSEDAAIKLAARVKEAGFDLSAKLGFRASIQGAKR